MLTLQKIHEDYLAIAQKWDATTREFPVPTEPDHQGQEHLEITQNTYSLIVTERGKITNKRSTESKDELLYWIFSDQAFASGWSYSMQNRAEGKDFRRAAFNHALSKMKQLSDVWADRFRQDIESILEQNPYVDD